MFNSKTYFEQVPLEFVKHIVEEQVRMEPAGEAIEATDKEPRRGSSLEAERRTILKPRKIVRVRSLNQS